LDLIKLVGDEVNAAVQNEITPEKKDKVKVRRIFFGETWNAGNRLSFD